MGRKVGVMFSMMERGILFWVSCLSFWVFQWVIAVGGLDQEVLVLLQMRKSMKDPHNALKSWENSSFAPCNWYGVSCDNITGMVTEITIERKSLNGPLYSDICQLQSLKELHLAFNEFYGDLASGIMKCTELQSLNLTKNSLSGSLPDFSPLKFLQLLDLTYNNFTGKFPASVGKLEKLISLNLAENPFVSGRIPQQLMNLKKLRQLYLSNCNLVGEIPNFVFDFIDLALLDLSTNNLIGSLPREIGKLTKLYQLELYDNSLCGNIPPEIGKLTLLQYFDASKNMFSGNIPEEVGNLRNLVSFQLYMNKLSGQIPEGFGDFKYLESLSLYRNNLTGQLPQRLGRLSKLNLIDVSENQFTGPLPKDMCRGGNLQYLLVLDNFLTGALPESYGDCKSLLRCRVNNNNLTGKIPKRIWGLPNVVIIDLSFNNFVGELTPEIRNAKHLSELYINNNHFSGNLVPEIGKAGELVKLEVSSNHFTGLIPKEIGNLKHLTALYLQENMFEGSIPAEIGFCTSLVIINLAENHLKGFIPKSLASIEGLSSLNLSSNRLSGPIPDSLSTLKLSFIDFSYNQLSGPVPYSLIINMNSKWFLGNPELCAESSSTIDHTLRACTRSELRKKSRQMIFLPGFVIGVLVISWILLRRKKHQKKDDFIEKSWDSSWKLKFFHNITFTEKEISEALLDEENVIGSGGSGKVYRVDLKNNLIVAVKQIWPVNINDNKQNSLTKLMKSEMDILGTIRHKNIVKLYCCLSNGSSDLLVYEYGQNGNLFDALHKFDKARTPKRSGSHLNWPTRYKIALGVAHGLAYLHHDCLPAIVHRDVKSSNILLDDLYEAKIADFGIAKVLQASGESDYITSFAGTHGYIAPEYAHSFKVTEKTDIYSFGVVLLELITGKQPFEPEYGENKDIVSWISHKICTHKDAFEVLDSKISKSFEEEMIKALKIAMRCTYKLPELRPSMRQVVQMLLDADPCANNLITSKNGKLPKRRGILVD